MALIARTAGPLQALAAELGDRARAFPCDLTNPDDVAKVVQEITAHFGGPPDTLVNNAGLFILTPVESMTPEDFAAVVQTNLIAPFILTRALLPAMRARGSGTVVTLGSIADRNVFPENGAYAASKHGLRALQEVMRMELRGSGVRAILVSPGPVDTALWDPVDPDTRPGFTPRASMLSALDVADAVWFAMSRPANVTIDELRLSRS